MNRKKLLLVLMLAVFAANARPTEAAKTDAPKKEEEIAVCKNPDGLQVDLYVDYGNLDYDETKSVKELSFDLSQNLIDAYGILKNSMGYKMTANFQTNYQNCVYLEKAEVLYKLEDMIIYIDESLKPGSCAYNIVKERKNEEVRMLRTSLRKFAPDIKSELTEKLSAIKPKKMLRNEERFKEAAIEGLKEEANAVTKELMQKLTDLIEAEKKKTDRLKPQEEDLFKKCPKG